MKLDVQIDITKEAVESAWEPLGLEILEDIRKHFDAKQLPVIIYTQRGFSLLDNNQLEKVEKLEGNWLQKKIAQPNTERIAINRVLNNKNSFKPVVNFYRTIIIFFIAVMIYYLIQSLNLDKQIDILVSVFGSLITFFPLKFLENLYKK